MKNKKAEQIEKKRKHQEEIKKAKRRKRNAEPLLSRGVPKKEEKKKILIVCEGKNTEPSYFNRFKLTTATIKSVGEGNNTMSLVKRAIQLSKEEQYDKVWCVFDKDDFPSENFNNAIFKARGNNFGVAYSNQAFEYWLILHFEDHQGGPMNRDQYSAKLNNYLKEFGVSYDSESKIITEEIFEVLLAKDEIKDKTRQKIACQRAERILLQYDNTSPAIEESSTTVHLLVKELESYK
ncbi:MAG: RloB family protein [Bacteroidota bacterium]